MWEKHIHIACTLPCQCLCIGLKTVQRFCPTTTLQFIWGSVGKNHSVFWLRATARTTHPGFRTSCLEPGPSTLPLTLAASPNVPSSSPINLFMRHLNCYVKASASHLLYRFITHVKLGGLKAFNYNLFITPFHDTIINTLTTVYTRSINRGEGRGGGGMTPSPVRVIYSGPPAQTTHF